MSQYASENDAIAPEVAVAKRERHGLLAEMRLLLAPALIAALTAGCTRPQASGLDETAIEATAKAPDAPPVSGKLFGVVQKECNDGDASECSKLASAFLFGSAETSKDEARSTRLFWKACARNDALSCHFIGRAFRDGVGGTKEDLTVAKKWFAKACSLGHQASCTFAQSKNAY